MRHQGVTQSSRSYAVFATGTTRIGHLVSPHGAEPAVRREQPRPDTIHATDREILNYLSKNSLTPAHRSHIGGSLNKRNRALGQAQRKTLNHRRNRRPQNGLWRVVENQYRDNAESARSFEMEAMASGRILLRRRIRDFRQPLRASGGPQE